MTESTTVAVRARLCQFCAQELAPGTEHKLRLRPGRTQEYFCQVWTDGAAQIARELYAAGKPLYEIVPMEPNPEYDMYVGSVVTNVCLFCNHVLTRGEMHTRPLGATRCFVTQSVLHQRTLPQADGAGR